MGVDGVVRNKWLRLWHESVRTAWKNAVANLNPVSYAVYSYVARFRRDFYRTATAS